MTSIPGPPGLEVRQVPNKGFGLFTTVPQPAAAQVFTDEPAFVMQHSGNRRVVAACAKCSGFVGSIRGQLEVVFGEARFAPLLGAVGDLVKRWDAQIAAESGGASSGSVVRCAQGCGEMYCSEACRDAHFSHSHNLLCTGPVDCADHPLLRFKYHALEHADTLLLAAQVMSHLINRAMASGGGADVMRGLMTELFGFCHAPFREACRAPPGREKDHEFLAHTDNVVNEAAKLLHAALQIHAPVETAVLFENGAGFFSEVLGLFEYNNIDVEVVSPIGPFVLRQAQALVAAAGTTPQAANDVMILERLLREKEFVMRCVWGEDTTGNFGDEVAHEAKGSAAAVDAAMDGLVTEQTSPDEFNAGVANAAMAVYRAEVDSMTLEQLVQAQWPTLHGTGLFPSVARINHSCAPNVKLDFHSNCGRITATSLLPLEAGQELSISYVRKEQDVHTRRRELLEYGFVCECERCVQEDTGGVRKTQRRLK